MSSVAWWSASRSMLSWGPLLLWGHSVMNNGLLTRRKKVRTNQQCQYFTHNKLSSKGQLQIPLKWMRRKKLLTSHQIHFLLHFEITFYTDKVLHFVVLWMQCASKESIFQNVYLPVLQYIKNTVLFLGLPICRAYSLHNLTLSVIHGHDVFNLFLSFSLCSRCDSGLWWRPA